MLQAKILRDDKAPPAPVQKHGHAWFFAIWLAALLPFFQAILTWDYDGRMTDGWFALRHFSFPAILGEIFIIIIALRNGMLPSRSLSGISKLAKILLAIWGTVAIVSTFLLNEGQTASLLTLARFALHGLFLMALLHAIKQARDFSIHKWLYAVTAGICAYIFSLILFALTVPEPGDFPWMLRMPSATNIRQIANIIAIPAIAPIALLLFGKTKKKWLWACALFIITGFIAWSGSRGALLGMIAGSVGALIFMRTLPSIQPLGITLVSFIAGLLSSIALPLPSGSFGLFRFVDKVQTSGNVTSGRAEIWIDTITEIGKSPWTGHGAGRFNANMHELHGIDFNHPHNFILQFAYDWGVLGAGAALMLLAMHGWAILRKVHASHLAGFAALGGFLTLLTIGLVDGALFYPLTIMMAIAILAPVFEERTDLEGADK